MIRLTITATNNDTFLLNSGDPFELEYNHSIPDTYEEIVDDQSMKPFMVIEKHEDIPGITHGLMAKNADEAKSEIKNIVDAEGLSNYTLVAVPLNFKQQ